MSTRRPTVAGQFYPFAERECRAEVESCLADIPLPGPAEPASQLRRDLAAGTEQLVGGIVPHAGWMCSGAVAAEVLRELNQKSGIETFVVFGAAHRLKSTTAALYAQGAWATPFGEIAIDEALAAAVLDCCPQIRAEEEPHLIEHSIEVQVPFIQHLAPAARLLPILVPHVAAGPAIGRAVAEQARRLGRNVVFLGSTDLTHYGPRYGFTPKGADAAGLQWAKDVNDRQLIDLICRLQAEKVAPHAVQHQNACGGGAVAATIAACREAGATRGVLLHHTTSNEVLCSRYGQMDDAVGYAGIVFSRPLTR